MKKTVSTPIGFLTVCEENNVISSLILNNNLHFDDNSQLLIDAEKQLIEYFQGVRSQFTLPLAPEGTNFQKTVWKALTEIPYGEVRSYKEVAEMIGHPKAYRAVGSANHCNPLPIFIPCHRVIGSNGNLTGYALGLSAKEYLIKLEQKKLR